MALPPSGFPPPTDVIAEDPHAELKKKIKSAFQVFDKDSKNLCDIREVPVIIRSLNIVPQSEKQMKR